MEQAEKSPVALIPERPASRSEKRKQGRLRKEIVKNRYLYLLALPGLLFFLIFKYIPMAGIIIAFQNYSPFKGVLHSPWVGLDHFERFFSNPDFLMLFRNTMGINVLNLILFFPLPIFIAVFLNELRSELYKKFIQTVIYMPHFLSWVIIAGLTFLLFSKGDGLVNKVIESFGGEKIDVLTDPNSFWMMIVVQSIWKEAGWGTIIFLAAIASVDPGLYEAARMDGAGRLRQIWHVTLPAIRSVIVVMLILRLGHMMDVGFEQIFLMYNGAVSQVAEVFDTYVYTVGIKQGQFSYSTAAGLFKSVVGLILVVVSNKLAKKMGEEGVY
ncbi:ABC transporter permease [Paenibacillus hamazuiensis]|uniref:ABC transporter permease n=1 Tax=Paenibacillus hamazuiensis TaxID=2936508 RepID=UPI00200F7165|nr:sugar ABC transporter permease [Paenibacillus hamazuiensis]